MLQFLECRSFRNLEDLEWRPKEGRHLILGPNGAGKTSLLEAVYLVATTRSFRSYRLEACIRHGENRFMTRAEAETDRRTMMEVGWGPEGRFRTINGERGSLVDHLSVLPVVAWAAPDVELLTGPPKIRRRFMDQGVVGLRPASLVPLSRYRQALAQKRRLLAEGGRGLESWNGVLAEAAVEIISAREEYCQLLARSLRKQLATGNLVTVPIDLTYRPSIPLEASDSNSVLALLAEVSARERESRRPLLGPHLDELDILWGGHGVRDVASAGERKTLCLALIAARGNVLQDAGREPIYLLDDVDTELDSQRLKAVWKLFENARQVLVTSNRPEVWEGLDISFRWRLESGRMVLPIEA